MILIFANFAYTLLVLNYSCVGFMVSYFFYLYMPVRTYTHMHAENTHTDTHILCSYTYIIETRFKVKEEGKAIMVYFIMLRLRRNYWLLLALRSSLVCRIRL